MNEQAPPPLSRFERKFKCDFNDIGITLDVTDQGRLVVQKVRVSCIEWKIWMCILAVMHGHDLVEYIFCARAPRYAYCPSSMCCARDLL